MNKVTLNLSQKEGSFVFAGETIIVKPMSLSDQVEILNSYLETFFLSEQGDRPIAITEYNRFAAQKAMMLAIIDRCTNISIADEKENHIIDIEGVISSGLWHLLEEAIPNYFDFEFMTSAIVNDIIKEIEMKHSVGYAMGELILRLTKFLEKLSDVDVSPEGIARLETTVKEFVGGIKESPVGGILLGKED